MNKKFSTLVASLLLVAGSAAYTPAFGQIPVSGVNGELLTSTNLERVGVSAYDAATNPTGGYQVGQSYFLGTYNQYLTVTNAGYLIIESASSLSVSDIANSVWELASLNTTAGATAPQYSFVNKKTGYILAFNPSAAVNIVGLTGDDLTNKINAGSNQLGGTQTEWLSSPSYVDPYSDNGNYMYAALKDDYIIALAQASEGRVVLVKTTKAQLDYTSNSGSTLLKINPYVLNATKSLMTMSPRQLNTMLGLTGEEAGEDSYFTLDFAPEATTNGEKNMWSEELQAVAIQQYEQKWGGLDVISNAAFASLYPKTDKNPATDSYSDLRNAKVTGFNDTEAQWVTLRNRDGKYLVVDTVYVKGTEQNATPRLTFAWDDLYNAKNETRYRNPKSYLFRFDYNPLTNQMEIRARGFYAKPGEFVESDDAFGYGVSEKSYYQSYETQAQKLASYWTSSEHETRSATTEEEQASNPTTIIKASLASINEVTVGKKDNGDATKASNLFTITFGGAAKYVPTIMPNGAYLIKVISSPDHREREGQYLVNNLGGSPEYIEQAVRQNFQHMPAAQWILTSPTQTPGAPVTITNREFSTYGLGGILYAVAGQADQAYMTATKETYQFIKVAEPADKYQGYLYVADDTIAERVFNFNYLHELAMDKSINTLSDKDSVVWVDANGGAIDFELVKAFDDEYGETTSGVTRLTRRAYNIKVKDASKVDPYDRYLAYDSNLKKYVISTTRKNTFFLKENNEVEGENCYYTLLNTKRFTVVSVKGGAEAYNEAGIYSGFEVTSGSDQVVDEDVRGMFLGEKKKILDPETGLTTKEVYIVKVFDTYKDASNFVSPYNNAVSVVPTANNKFVVLFGRYCLPAFSKVSVDNNTLNLTNGIIYDGSSNEVANSAFAVVPGNNPKYRNLELEKPANMAIYRVKSTEKAYLYEDATSIYSKDLNFNFLGVEDKGVEGKNPTLFVDTAYVERDGNTQYRYLLGLRETVTEGVADICPICGKEDCEHSKVSRTHTDAWYLVNLSDSVALNKGAAKAKYQWNREYTRLGFVQACHRGDSLIIKNSVWTGNTDRIDPYSKTNATTWASKDTIKLDKNDNYVTFSLRLIDDSDNFLLQSRSNAWVKIQNGVPVLAEGTYHEVAKDAEIFNIEASDKQATANEVVAAEVSVVAAQGAIIVKGAAGKVVTVANILGQTIANQVAASDNVTIAAPAGIAVVTVDGEATKVIVK